MKLQYLIHYPDSNTMEAAWVDTSGVRVKCRSYAGNQMNDLRIDLGVELFDYAAIVDQCEASYIPPPPKPQVIPAVVSAWGMRKALNQLGLRKSVEDAVAASIDQNLKDGWQYAREFNRTDDLVVAMGASLGKTPAEMDALFILADSL